MVQFLIFIINNLLQTNKTKSYICYHSPVVIQQGLFKEKNASRPYPDHVIDCVDVTVTSVHPDCPQRETKLLPRTVDHDGLPWVRGTEGGVSARRGVS